jgi:hypothetical protein
LNSISKNLILPILKIKRILEEKEHSMEDHHKLTPMSEILNMLRDKGFTNDFIMHDQGIKNKNSGETYEPEELTIVKVFRFEGESDPADMSVIYAMKSSKGDKGIFLDAFGTYADYDGQKAAEYLRKVKIIEDH